MENIPILEIIQQVAINTRKTIGFFAEFSNVLTIFNFVDNLRQPLEFYS